MLTTSEEIQAHVQRALAAALRYYVGHRKQSFVEFESDLQPFIEAYVSQLPSFTSMSLRLHLIPTGNRFDIGLIFDEGMVAVQLFEVNGTVSSTTTFH